MYRLAILYAPRDSETEKKIKVLGKIFKKIRGLKVSIKNADDALMTEVQAADCVILGQNSDNGSVHSNFKEIARAMKGINLSGRLAGFFSFTGGASIFREIVKDTGISCFNKELNLSSGSEKKIEKWVDSFYKEFQKE